MFSISFILTGIGILFLISKRKPDDIFPLCLESRGEQVCVFQNWLNMEAALLVETKYRDITGYPIEVNGVWDLATEKLAKQIRSFIVSEVFYTDEDRTYALETDLRTPTLQSTETGAVFVGEVFYNYYISKMARFD